MPSEYDPGRPVFTKWFWKDFTTKTQDMSTLEVGAYTRLLGYARTCSADFCTIPADHRRLCRVTGLSMNHWLRVAPRVMVEFPTILRRADGTIVRSSSRLIQDAIEWLQVSVLQQSRRTGGQPPVHRTASTRARAQSREKSEVRSQIEPKEESNLPLVRPRSRSAGGGFDEWYRTYPRHVARRAAERAYASALKRASVETLAEGAARYARECAGKDPDKVKHPATWLNGDCWLDEDPVPVEEDDLMTRLKEAERAAEERHRLGNQG